MNLITLDKISKSYSEKILLDNVTLNINEGDKKGEEQGREEGIAQGIAQGRREGEIRAKIKMIDKLRTMGIKFEDALRVAEIDKETFEKYNGSSIN